MEDYDALLNTNGVPQDERVADFIAESRANRSFCYETAAKGALRVAESPEAFRQYLDVQSRFLRYTANNVLLILEQNPDAKRLGDFGYWRDRGASVRRGERGQPILVMEPGKEYRREDNTIGQYYNAKKLYDISQTDMPEEAWETGRAYEDRQRIQALISRTPVGIHTVGEEEAPRDAVFIPEEHSIFVRKGMEADRIFQSISRELAHAEYAKGRADYDRSGHEFQAKCVSYILCRKYGVEPEGPVDFSEAKEMLSGLEPQDIKHGLSQIRDAAGRISERMEKSLAEQDRRQKSQAERQMPGER